MFARPLQKLHSGMDSQSRMCILLGLEMGAASLAPAPRRCEERARLECIYKRAEEAFDIAQNAVREKVGKSSKEEYLALDRTVNEAWDTVQRCRRALAVHMAEHGCGLAGALSAGIEKPFW